MYDIYNKMSEMTSNFNNYNDKVGKEMKRKRYEENKELIKAKSLLQYYKKKDDTKTFKEKHNDKYIMILENTIESM